MKSINLFSIFIILCLSVPMLNGQELYDLNHLTQIELSFVEKDWRHPLHYYYSLKKGKRHIGDAVINGQKLEKVGVRFKGFSSYKRGFKKNPMNIKLNFKKTAEYGIYKTLKLTNGNLDPSWLRESLGYEIARKYMVAPQANFAQIYVNREYHGLFGNVEDVDGEFCARYFYSNPDNILIKGDSPLGIFSGKHASLEYLGVDTTAYQAGYELKSKYGWAALMNLTKTLKNRPYDLPKILNMNSAIWMLAFNNVLVNLDSYSDFQHNYYLFQDDNGRFNFIVWDLNLSFDGLGKPTGTTIQPEYDPLAFANDGKYPLINLVLNNSTYRKMYFAHCRTILAENFENGWYKERAKVIHELIEGAVKSDANWVFSYDEFKKNLDETVIHQNIVPFPYPGITELIEARVEFLKNHKEYQKKAPKIISANAKSFNGAAFKIAITAKVDNAKKVLVNYRDKLGGIFEEVPLFDDGKHEDGLAADGVFGNIIPAKPVNLEYYIYAENMEAGVFAPKRAAMEVYRLD